MIYILLIHFNNYLDTQVNVHVSVHNRHTILLFTDTVKHDYSKHAYNESMVTVKSFLFPVTLLHCKLDEYNELRL